jgi:hypothetical protein
MIGANAITSFSDGSAEADVATEVYEEIVQEELSFYPWSFAKDQSGLSLLVAAPVDPTWTYGYQLPNGVMKILRMTVNGYNIEYERFGDKVFCGEAADVVATYVFRARESKWPPYFSALVSHKLAALFATAIAERPGLAQSLYGELGVVRQLARTSDASGQTTRRIVQSRFKKARGYSNSDVHA